MDKFEIQGSNRLQGEVEVLGVKNGILPLIAASLLAAKGKTVITNVPDFRDVATLSQILRQMGAVVNYDRSSRVIEIDCESINSFTAPYELVKQMRASFLVVGPLLTRFGQAEVSLPGGCAIGSRPVDVHIEGMRKMGAQIDIINGFIHARAPQGLTGAELNLGKITVTGTENLMMAAVLAKGRTVIQNAACEPEVEDLANFLNVLGAKIQGAGSATIIIDGVKALHGGSYHVLPDRIEAGTYLIAGAMTRGCVTVREVEPKTLGSVLDKLRQAGAQISIDGNSITLDMQGKRPKAVDITTAPYPEFPTDMQAQFVA